MDLRKQLLGKTAEELQQLYDASGWSCPLKTEQRNQFIADLGLAINLEGGRANWVDDFEISNVAELFLLQYPSCSPIKHCDFQNYKNRLLTDGGNPPLFSSDPIVPYLYVGSIFDSSQTGEVDGIFRSVSQLVMTKLYPSDLPNPFQGGQFPVQIQDSGLFVTFETQAEFTQRLGNSFSQFRNLNGYGGQTGHYSCSITKTKYLGACEPELLSYTVGIDPKLYSEDTELFPFKLAVILIYEWIGRYPQIILDQEEEGNAALNSRVNLAFEKLTQIFFKNPTNQGLQNRALTYLTQFKWAVQSTQQPSR